MSAALVLGQARPDFSGKWTPIASTAQMSDPFTVLQDATTITISAQLPKSEKHSLSLKLDGSPGKVTLPAANGTTLERDAKAEWSGDKLVVQIEQSSGKTGPFTTKQTWSLDGERLVIEIVNTSATTGKPLGPPGTTTYRKQ